MKKRLLAMLLVLILCLTACNQNGNPPADPEDSATSYEDITPSKYIEIADEDYKGFELNLDIYDYTEVTLENQILSLLNEHKPSEPYRSEYGTFDPVISAGDDVYIYYRGYILNEDGSRNYMDRMSNMNDSSPTKLTIGEGRFIPGFESALVGKRLDGYRAITAGPVYEDSIAFITISYIANDETNDVIRTEDRIIDLSLGREKAGSIYRQNLYDVAMSLEVGGESVVAENVTMSSLVVGEGSVRKSCRIIVKLNYAVTGYDKESFETVYVRFPFDYNDTDFSSKEAWFEVYPVFITEYYNDEAGEGVFDDEFVKDKVLGNNQKWIDALAAKYPSASSLLERYKLYLNEMVELEYRENYNILLTDAILSHYMETVTVKKYPTAILENTKQELTAYLEEVVQMYEETYNIEIPDSYTPPSTSTGTGIVIGNTNIEVSDGTVEFIPIEGAVQIAPYITKDSLAKNMFDEPDAENWQDAINRAAPKYVLKRLILYYIFEKEGIIIGDESIPYGIEIMVKNEYYSFLNAYFWMSGNENEYKEDYIGKEDELFQKIYDILYNESLDERSKNNIAIQSIAFEKVISDFGITIHTLDD